MALRVLRLAAVSSIIAFGLTARPMAAALASTADSPGTPPVTAAASAPAAASLAEAEEPPPTDPASPIPSASAEPAAEPPASDPPAPTPTPISEPPLPTEPPMSEPPSTEPPLPTEPPMSEPPSTEPPPEEPPPAEPPAEEPPTPTPSPTPDPSPDGDDPPQADPAESPSAIDPSGEPEASPSPDGPDVAEVPALPTTTSETSAALLPTPAARERDDPARRAEPLAPLPTVDTSTASWIMPAPVAVAPAPVVAAPVAQVAPPVARPVAPEPAAARGSLPHLTGLLDELEPVSAGLVAGMAATNRGSAAVTVAIEFGRAGGGWAGAIVFNLWLRRQLRERRMSQRQLAALSGVDHSTISRLLQQDRRPSLATATKLARALKHVRNEFDAADYFERMPEESLFPARRVEMALRSDELLSDDDVMALMRRYLDARQRRQGSDSPTGRTSTGRMAKVARASRTRSAAGRTDADATASPRTAEADNRA